jgi:hypothetical protein
VRTCSCCGAASKTMRILPRLSLTIPCLWFAHSRFTAGTEMFRFLEGYVATYIWQELQCNFWSKLEDIAAKSSWCVRPGGNNTIVILTMKFQSRLQKARKKTWPHDFKDGYVSNEVTTVDSAPNMKDGLLVLCKMMILTRTSFVHSNTLPNTFLVTEPCMPATFK